MSQPMDRDVNVRVRADTSNYSAGVAQATQQTNALSGSVDKLSSKLDGLAGRAGKKLLLFSAADQAVLLGLTGQAAAFDKQLSTLAATAAINHQSFNGFKGSVESLAKQFPITRGEAAQLVTALSNLGITGSKQIGELAATFVKLGAATGESVGELATGLTQLSRQMGVTDAATIAKYANSLLTVSKNAGVSATGVLAFAQAIAPMGRAAGIGEAQLLGISTAFNKAGADGFVAANAFNSIIGDITKKIASGSPDIAKYANLIGVTSDQFKKMDKAQAFTQIFEAIAKQGPQAINTLDRLGIDGVRAQAAIQAVVQSGGLQKSIDQAVGASGDTKNLDKGAKAAMGGLADAVVRLRTAFSQFGLEVGTTFGKPLTVITDAVTKFLNTLTGLTKPMAPIIGGLGAIAAAFTAIGGAALITAGLIAKIALGKLVLGSAAVQGVRRGIQAGRVEESGGINPITGKRVVNEFTRAEAAGTMKPWQRPFYGAGKTIGGLFPVRPPAEEGEQRPPGITRRQRILRLPIRTATTLTEGQQELLQNSERSALRRTAPTLDPLTRGAANLRARTLGRLNVPGGAPAEEGTGGRHRAPSDTEQASRAAATGLNQVAGSARHAASAEATTTRAARDRARADEQTTTTSRVLREETGRLAGAFGRLGMTSLATGGRQVGGALATGASKLGGAAMGFLGGPVGLALTGGIAGMELYSALQRGQKQDKDYSSVVNPLSVLSEKLGITAGKVADFGNVVATATKNVPTTVEGAKTISQADIATSQGTGRALSVPVIGVTAKTQPKNVAAAVATVKSLGITDPKAWDAVKKDLIQIYGPDMATQILAQSGQGDTDYGALGKAANKANTGFDWTSFRDWTGQTRKGAKQITGTAVTGIQTDFQTNIDKFSAGYADQKKLADFLAFAAASGSSKEVGGASKQLFGVDIGDKLGKKLDSTDDPQKRKQIVLDTLQKTDQGSDFIKYMKTLGGTTDLGAIDDTLKRLMVGQTSETQQAIAGSGKVGAFALKDTTVQAAVNAPQDVNAQYQAWTALANQATKTTKTFSQADGELQKLKAAIKDTTDPMYQLAEAAQQEIEYRRQLTLPTLGRVGQLGSQEGAFRTAINTGGPDQPDRIKATKTAMDQAVEAERQYDISLIKMIQSTTNQLDDAWADHIKQQTRATEDFHLSQNRATDDFTRTQLRSQEDFGIQMARAAKQAAESWLDPWKRVFGDYTMSGEALVYNLKDQNERIKKQFDELNQLKAKGLSTEAIQTLGLEQAGKAQQVSQLVGDTGTDPKLIAQINAEVAKRIGGVTQITQSSFNEQFQNTIADFTRSVGRNTEDFARSMKRGTEDFNKNMQRGEDDFNLGITRMQRDLNLSLQEITGDYASVAKQLGISAADFKKKMPDAANTIIGSLSQAGDVMKAYVADLAQQQKDAAQAAAHMYDPNNPRSLPPGHDVPQIPPTMPGVGAAPAAAPKPGSLPYAGGFGVRAEGGIDTRPVLAWHAEAGSSEVSIPLNDRGHQYMAGMYAAIAKSLVQKMTTAGHGLATAVGGSTTYVDSSTNFSGPVYVEANDPNALARQLADKARLKKLTRPPRATAAAS